MSKNTSNNFYSKFPKKKCITLLKTGDIVELMNEFKDKCPSPKYKWDEIILNCLRDYFDNQKIVRHKSVFDYFDLIDETISNEKNNLIYKVLFVSLFKDLGELTETFETLENKYTNEIMDDYLNMMDNDSKIFYENNVLELFETI